MTLHDALDTQQYFGMRLKDCPIPPVCTGCHEPVADNNTATWVRHFESCPYYSNRITQPRYEIINLGVQHPDYFQGFGSSVEFDQATYGIGSTRYDAYKDACEQVAQMLTSAEFDTLQLPEPQAVGPNTVISDEDDEAGCYWHVGIRFSIPDLDTETD